MISLGSPDLGQDLTAVVAQLGVLRRLLYTPEAFERRNALVSDWSQGAQAVHATLALVGCYKAVEACILRPDEGRGEEASETGYQVLESAHIPRGFAKAPAQTEPDKPLDQVKEALEFAEAKWKGLAERTDEIREATGKRAHPFLGHFDAVEWVRFAAVHTAHHLQIAEEIATG